MCDAVPLIVNAVPRGSGSKEWTDGVSGETAQLLEALMGVSVSAQQPHGKSTKKESGENGRGLGGGLEETGHPTLSVAGLVVWGNGVQSERQQQLEGHGRDRQVLVSDDEGEPVHAAVCLLEEEEEEEEEEDVSLPSKPGRMLLSGIHIQHAVTRREGKKEGVKREREESWREMDCTLPL